MKHQYNCIELSSRELYTYELSSWALVYKNIGLETRLESFAPTWKIQSKKF